ncbi:MAG: hypothetical protein E6556_10580 [Pantoea sp.]|uniref:hypothetical protein n=1 Tax=Pantoea piersonii TaxID=2364647 RepID=UPI0028A69FDE|nr:hypothetical protein [Pantoea piersonii]MDU6433331.1 hypothetical protein [Pantoea sp.]
MLELLLITPFFLIKPLTMDDFKKGGVLLRTVSSGGPTAERTASDARGKLVFLQKKRDVKRHAQDRK